MRRVDRTVIPGFIRDGAWRTAFPGFVRILHPMFRMAGPLPAAEGLDARILNLLPGNAEIVSFNHSTEVPVEGIRQFWPQVFEAMDLEFDPEQAESPPPWDWPADLTHPSEGSLDERVAETLPALLARFARGEVLVSYFLPVPNLDGSSESPVFRLRLPEPPDPDGHEYVRGYGEYWWPDDLTWVVHTDYDSCATVVAGPERLLQAVLREPWFEAYRITALPPGSRADVKGASPRGNRCRCAFR